MRKLLANRTGTAKAIQSGSARVSSTGHYIILTSLLIFFIFLLHTRVTYNNKKQCAIKMQKRVLLKSCNFILKLHIVIGIMTLCKYTMYLIFYCTS